jgi:hypothetical protein
MVTKMRNFEKTDQPNAAARRLVEIAIAVKAVLGRLHLHRASELAPSAKLQHAKRIPRRPRPSDQAGLAVAA